jgi:hypothetical protein
VLHSQRYCIVPYYVRRTEGPLAGSVVIRPISRICIFPRSRASKSIRSGLRPTSQLLYINLFAERRSTGGVRPYYSKLHDDASRTTRKHQPTNASTSAKQIKRSEVSVIQLRPPKKEHRAWALTEINLLFVLCKTTLLFFFFLFLLRFGL